MTDASELAVGAVLQQHIKGVWHISRKMNPAETLYSTFDRELLAIYLAIRAGPKTFPSMQSQQKLWLKPSLANGFHDLVYPQPLSQGRYIFHGSRDGLRHASTTTGRILHPLPHHVATGSYRFSNQTAHLCSDNSSCSYPNYSLQLACARQCVHTHPCILYVKMHPSTSI